MCSNFAALLFLFLFSHWCQSLLYQKLFNLRKQEVKEIQKIIADYNQKVRVIDDIDDIEDIDGIKDGIDDFDFSKYKPRCSDPASVKTILEIYAKYANDFCGRGSHGSLIHEYIYVIWHNFIHRLQLCVKQPAQTTPMQPEGQGTPSLSPTPSPAGSVGSVGSQSSGYSSGELANRGAASGQGPGMSSGQYVNMPLHVHNATLKQSQHLGLLVNSLDLWDQAISKAKEEEHRGAYERCKSIVPSLRWRVSLILIYNRQSDKMNNNSLFSCSCFLSDFFIDLDQRLGPLTQSSSLRQLVRYVQAGIKKLRAL